MIFLKIRSDFYWFLLPAITMLVLGSCTTVQAVNYNKSDKTNSIFISTCPAEVEDNKAYMEDFLTTPEWEQGRQESGTDHLTTSQITVLTTPEFTTTCETLNERFQEFISDTYASGGEKYELTYYKVGSNYFVIISRQQPSDPDYVASGVEFINILDENLEEVKNYFF